jgi:hypothetical protein
MLEQHLAMSKRSSSLNCPGVQQQQQKKKSAKKKSADSYVQKARTILKVREDQVKQYTNMLSTGITTSCYY